MALLLLATQENYKESQMIHFNILLVFTLRGNKMQQADILLFLRKTVAVA